MMLPFAMALLLVATSGMGAAPQGRSKQAEARKTVQIVTATGECTKLVQAGVAMAGCNRF